MNIRNEKRKLRKSLRVLELIDLATEKLEILESNKRMAEAMEARSVYNDYIHKIEIEEAVIKRLTNHYWMLQRDNEMFKALKCAYLNCSNLTPEANELIKNVIKRVK